MHEFFARTSVFNNIAFDDERHSYTLNGTRTISVTKVTGSVAPPFIEGKVALDSVRKKLRKDEVVPPMELLRRAEDLCLQWKVKNLLARAKGSAVHKYIETNLANKVQPYPSDIVMNEFTKDFKKMPRLMELVQGDPVKPMYDRITPMVKQFISDIQGKMHRVRSELVIGSPKYMVCGMIDQIFYNMKSGGFEIWDWKTNSDFDTDSNFKLNAPCAHLDKSKLTEYSLQLHCYKRIFEEETGIPIVNLYLCWFSEREPIYRVFKCRDLSNEAKYLLENAGQLVAQSEAEKTQLTKEFDEYKRAIENGTAEIGSNQKVIFGTTVQNMAHPAG